MKKQPPTKKNPNHPNILVFRSSLPSRNVEITLAQAPGRNPPSKVNYGHYAMTVASPKRGSTEGFEQFFRRIFVKPTLNIDFVPHSVASWGALKNLPNFQVCLYSF